MLAVYNLVLPTREMWRLAHQRRVRRTTSCGLYKMKRDSAVRTRGIAILQFVQKWSKGGGSRRPVHPSEGTLLPVLFVADEFCNRRGSPAFFGTRVSCFTVSPIGPESGVMGENLVPRSIPTLDAMQGVCLRS